MEKHLVIEKTIRRIRINLGIRRCFKLASWCFLSVAAGSVTLMLLSHRVCIPFVYRWMEVWGVFCLLVTLVVMVIKWPSKQEAIGFGDQRGYEARLQTYFEFRGDSSPMIQSFLEELEWFIMQEPSICYGKTKTGKWMILGVVLCVLTGALALWENPVRYETYQMEGIHEDVQNESQKLESVQSEIKDTIPENQQEAVQQVVAELQETLSQTYDYIEAASEMDAAQKQVQQIRNSLNTQEQQVAEGLYKELTGQENNSASTGSPEKSNTSEATNGFGRSAENQTSLSPMESGTDDSKAVAQMEDQRTTDAEAQQKASVHSQSESLEKLEMALQTGKERMLAKGQKQQETATGAEQAAAYTPGEVTHKIYGEQTEQRGGLSMDGGTNGAAECTADGVGGMAQPTEDLVDRSPQWGSLEQGGSEALETITGTRLTLEGQGLDRGQVTTHWSNDVLIAQGMMMLEKQGVDGAVVEAVQIIQLEDLPEERRSVVTSYFTHIHGALEIKEAADAPNH